MIESVDPVNFKMPNLTALRGFILGLVVLAFGQTGAKADCGDHVILGGIDAQARNSQAHRSQPGQPWNKPCNGPTCRKQAPMSPAIPLEVSKRLMDQPIWTGFLETGEPGNQAGFVSQSALFALSGGHPLGVFHPPRV